MKKNKKFMSIVAGAAIASQLLPMGTVIANADTRTCVHFPQGNGPKPHNGYGNDFSIYCENGQDGFRIMFDIEDNRLDVEPLEEEMLQQKLSNTSIDENYLTVTLTDKYKKTIEKDTFSFRGDDTIKTIVEKLKGVHFEVGQGIRFNYKYSDKSLVKISGEVGNASSCYEFGIGKSYLDITTFMIGPNKLERQEDIIKK